MTTKSETGAASLLIDLTDGKITVYHGTDETVLGIKKRAVEGDWDKLVHFLRRNLRIEWQV